ncbi:MAG: UMP kinase [Candidatus Magasanikbacteria bacterium CG_4_10_14_0_2_um_filter_37_12]|uniref:Uridylate kinase n=1 Tax=Candidatus Magasanikbacteria bacterium CG_4_10_14_0_2_um_filter_37_12 TaxID=1974637 RepID=A0A2M7V6P4_9BACT|nr:MAG: UMP kinase [Candidatus Magasanikbacteria bacterium CG_4_10_14_0_2_um_filter_37_12]
MKIISVGGSIVIPKTGFDIKFLKKFRKLILNEVKNGNKFILTIGGGATCRAYQDVAKKVTKLSDRDLDWVGIHSTILNANFVRILFGEHAYKEVVRDPSKKIKTNKPVIITAGWQPGHSTDTDAVLLAKTYGVKDIINLSNIEYVYDKDPNKYKNAKKIEQICWSDFRENIVGNTWNPGKSAPFDPIASREAEKLGLRVSILDGTNLKEVKNVLGGKNFHGTVIY